MNALKHSTALSTLIMLSAIIILVMSGCSRPMVETPGDCIWQGVAQAWIDQNENGIWDSNEHPLPGISFFVDDVLNNLLQVADYATSNLQGDARLLVWLPGCPDVKFEVYPEVPKQYHLTTPQRLTAPVTATAKALQFGFAYWPSVPTATPRPVGSLTCVPYFLMNQTGYGIAKHLSIAPSGEVWGEAGQSIFQFDWKTGQWNAYDKQANLPGSYVYALLATSDNMVWVSTSEGVASFDGKKWRTYRTEDGLLANRTKNTVVAPDRAVWFVSDTGASRLKLETGQVTTYPLTITHPTEYIDYGAMTPDGSLWLGSQANLSQLLPAQQSNTQPKWVKRQFPDYRLFSVSMPDNGLFSSSHGVLWVTGGTYKQGLGLASFDPSTNKWLTYDPRSTQYAMLAERGIKFALAADDTVWISTWKNGLIHLVPAMKDTSDQVKIIYYTWPQQQESEIYSMALAPDGAIWLGVQGSVIRCTVNAE
jgi:streptogramin lyase